MSFKSILSGLGKTVSAAVTDVEKAAQATANFVEGRVNVAEDEVQALHSDTFEPTPPTTPMSLGTEQYQKVNEPLFNGAPTDDFAQGQEGDCYLVASMASLAATHPEVLENAITANPDGSYTVTFHEPVGSSAADLGGRLGDWVQGVAAEGLGVVGAELPTHTVQVTVDGKLPEVNGQPSAVSGPELWPAIIEKAMAAQYGGYDEVGNGGFPASALELLTGKPVQTRFTALDSASSLFSAIQQGASSDQPMVASSKSTTSDGIVDSHVYSVLGAETVNGQQFVRLRNPWGTDGADGTLVPLSTFTKNFVSLDVGNT